MTIDVARVHAVDVHVHAEVSRDGHPSLSDTLRGAFGSYFGTGDAPSPTVPEIAAYYRERSLAAVVFTVDAETATGHPPIANEEVAESCAEHPDVLVPFASLDPWKGQSAVRRARRLVEDHGVRGFKFHPTLQGFFPDDRMAYPLYEAIQDLHVPALFHTGQTGVGAGLPGGGGLRLKYSDPLHLDDVAAQFPHLQVVLAHPSFPWQDVALAMATHKPNVFIDLSGWAPKYFPPQLVRYADTLLRHKVMFGSDFPAITPDRWLSDFERLDIRPEVRPLILKDNAARLLGLAGGSAAPAEGADGGDRGDGGTA